MRLSRSTLRKFGGSIAFVAIWEAAYRAGLLDPIIFAAPSLMWKAILDDGWAFLAAFRVTLLEIVAAIAIAWSLGVLLGLALGVMPGLSRFAAVVLSALIAVPLVILYPLFLAWFGLGPASKVVFGVVSGIFPIALNTMIGVQGIERNYARMAVAMGASPRQVMLQVLAPLAFPAILSGLRLGTALVVIGVVLSEMLASTDGLGFLISYHRALFNSGQVYLGIILALVVAGLANALLSALERTFVRRRAEAEDKVVVETERQSRHGIGQG